MFDLTSANPLAINQGSIVDLVQAELLEEGVAAVCELLHWTLNDTIIRKADILYV